MPIQIILRNPLDRDAREYLARAGVTDATARTQINSFVRSLKNLGMWSSFVCWPLRSSQNIGSSSSVYSLGGLATFTGSLVGGPAWGTDGLSVTATSMRMTTGFTPTATQAAMGVVVKLAAAGNTDGRLWTSDGPGTSRGLGMDAFNATGFRRLSNSFLSSFGTQSTNWTFLAVGGGATFYAQDGSRSTETALDLLTPHDALRLGDSSSLIRLGTYAFVWWYDKSMSAADYTNFRSLYKDTLGTGLGLP